MMLKGVVDSQLVVDLKKKSKLKNTYFLWKNS